MNAYPLYVKQENGDFKPSKNIFACGKCHKVTFIYNNPNYGVARKEDAEKCCTIQKCPCGKDLNNPFDTLCDDCKTKKWKEDLAKKEVEKFNKAKKISLSDYNHQYGFSSDGDFIQDIECYINDIDVELMDDSDYFWAVKKEFAPCISIDGFKDHVYENILSEFHDADGECTVDLSGFEEIEKALIKFNKLNDDKFQYIEDQNLAVVFTKKELKEFQK